jgi:hypothetical protein
MARLLLGEYLLLSTQDLRDLLCVRRAQPMHVTRGCEGFNLEDGIILVVSLSKKFTLTDRLPVSRILGCSVSSGVNLSRTEGERGFAHSWSLAGPA